MTVPANTNELLLRSAAPATYQVSRSLRFNAPDSAFLSRTPASTGNRRTWTWSGWIKRSGLNLSGSNTEKAIFGVNSTSNDGHVLCWFTEPDTLYFGVGYLTSYVLVTSQVFRDTGAWMHLVIAFDTTQATASNRVKMYVNGTEVTTFGTDQRSSIAQNSEWGMNTTNEHIIGRNPTSAARYFNGYLAEIHLIDGQALTPSSFAETDFTTGQWIPKLYSGSYGTNGFKLTFADNSAATAAALGKDTSGNSNNWTPNNLSVGNTKTIQVGTPSYPSAFTTTGNKTSDQTALSYVYWGGTYTGAATKIFRASDVSVFSTTIDVSGPSLDRYLWYSDDAINWTYIGNLASLSRPYTLTGYKYYATSEGSGSATITVGALPAGNDSLVDTPTSISATDTGIGGEIRGNYATLNPLNPTTATLSNGNLDCVTNNAHTHARSTIGMSSGKWYWEIVGTTNGNNGLYGIVTQDASFSNYVGQNASGWGYYADGQKYTNNTNTNYGASFTNNDVIGIAFDADNGTLTFYKNGTSQGQAFSGLTSGSYFAAVSDGGSTTSLTLSANFGQRPFAYTAPSGFKALCDTNLPAPVVAKPSTVMDVALYSGNSSTQSISGYNLSPDFVWVKTRSQANNNFLFDAVRGVGNWLISDSTTAETYSANTLTSFDSGGFTTGSNNDTNASGRTFVAWMWDAGSSTVTNTQGSITSSVRANASAGFSIVTFTGNGSNPATVGHGLGVAPRFIIFKRRDLAVNWFVYAGAIGNGVLEGLNTTSAYSSAATIFNQTAPSSTVFSLGNTDGNANGGTYVAYCFAPVAGYSSFGSYTGNGSTDGPFVYTGFRPRYVLQKKTSDVSAWAIRDAARDPYNAATTRLWTNFSSAESSADAIDLLSNGFKVRNTDTDWNASGATYIYAAFAENPFQYARAR